MIKIELIIYRFSIDNSLFFTKMKFYDTQTTKNKKPYDRPNIETYNFDIFGSKKLSQLSFLVFKKDKCNELHQKLKNITKNSIFYNEIAKVSISELYPHYLEIRNEYDVGEKYLSDIVRVLEMVYKEELENIKKMVDDRMVTFDNLSQVFLSGLKIVGLSTFGEKVGAVIKKTQFSHNGFCRVFYITAVTNYSNGKSFTKKNVSFGITEFTGLKSFDDLSARPMTNDDYIELTKRGKIFASFALGNHYRAYKGNMFTNTYYGPVLFGGQGRIIIDVEGHSLSDPNSYGYSYDDENESVVTELEDDKLCLTWPFLPAFSLSAKQWGQIFLKNVSDIKFDENAFDLLVLNEQKKNLTKILVTNATAGFTDIISGKSGGCIFLLHGSPGTGKTLTTESISELLHMPLYSVTSGELGTTPQEVEKTLQKILKLAQSWNAIILLDEADIFLQKRDNYDIVRNAIVGIFLRLLERYKGIMFLTTNRRTEIDEAFQSRITITFDYDDLSYYDRLQVWTNLLSASEIKIDEYNVKLLAKCEINGRQIKNIIRLANTLAINDKIQTNIDHFDQVMKILLLN